MNVSEQRCYHTKKEDIHIDPKQQMFVCHLQKQVFICCCRSSFTLEGFGGLVTECHKMNLITWINASPTFRQCDLHIFPLTPVIKAIILHHSSTPYA